MKKHTFHVSGTHCASYKILIEDILGEHDFIEGVQEYAAWGCIVL